MVSDILLQVALILLTIFIFLVIHDVPKRIFTKLRLRSRSDLQAKHHFVAGAKLLSQARSINPSRSTSAAVSLAKQAESEADKSISIDPTDAASHILKALSLDLQGLKPAAISALDVALSPPAVKSLSVKERADALFKRAEIRLSVERRRRRSVDPAVEDLTEAVQLSRDNVKAFCLLGECYETKKMKEEARRSYKDALEVDPGSAVARAGLDRISASS